MHRVFPAGFKERGRRTKLKKKQKEIISAAFLLFAILAVALSVTGPEALAKYKDKDILEEIHAEAVEEAGEGYRYALRANGEG